MVQGFTQFSDGFLVNISVIVVSNVHCTARACAIICFAIKHCTYVHVIKMQCTSG